MKFFHYIIVLSYLIVLPVFAQNEDPEASKRDPIDDSENLAVVPADAKTTASAEPSIFDDRKILTTTQHTRIKEMQTEFFSKHKCMVSYGFYDGHLPSIAVHQAWKEMVAKDENREFHLFLNIGAMRSSNILDIYYRYPPALKNTEEIDTILANLKRDLQSEVGLEALLKRSYESVNDELGYLRNKPTYESNVLEEKNAFEAQQLKDYILSVLKIIGLVIGPIIAILFIWSILSKIRNKRPYKFPDVAYNQRFGSKYSATSIAKIKK